MDQQQIARELIKFNKSVLDNTFNAGSAIQNQSEKIFTAFMDKTVWVPAEGKKAITAWVAAYKKGCEDFKTALDGKYEDVANYFLKKENTGTPGMKK